MLQLTIAVNAALALGYLAVGCLIAVGLVRDRHRGFNVLGGVTGLVFLACALGHLVHVEGYLAMAGQGLAGDPPWYQLIADSITLVPAIGYFALRREISTAFRAPQAVLGFKRQLETAEHLCAIGQDLARQTDFDELLPAIAQQARSLLGADYIVAAAYDETQQLRTAGDGTQVKGWSKAAVAAIERLGRATSNDEGPVLPNIELQERVASYPAPAYPDFRHHRYEGATAFMTVPLLHKRAITGVLIGGWRSRTTIAPSVVTSAGVLATEAAITLENARLIASLRRSQSQKDEFLSVAAHELKTPVTSLRGFAQLAIRQIDKDPSQIDRIYRSLKVIDTQSDKLSRLISQLLDVARIDAGRLKLERRSTDLSALVRDLTETLQPSATRQRIIVDAPPSVVAEVDPLRIEQVLINLIDNAIKYGPESGTIAIDLQQPAPGLIEIGVRDDGQGIPPEERNRIFDRFYQSRHDTLCGRRNAHPAGMGLGLYISRQITELHGGRLEVQTPAGGGTRFVVVLPAGAAPPIPDGDFGIALSATSH